MVQEIAYPEIGTERLGDYSLDDRLSSGVNDLEDFMPNDSFRNGEPRDAYAAMMASPMRGSVYFNKKEPRRAMHQSTRREGQYAESFESSNDVITSRIIVDGKRWQYRTRTDNSEIRRVFTLRDQGVELDIDSTLIQMSAHKGTERYDDLRKKLEAEASNDPQYDSDPVNLNNQVILQTMFDRYQRGLSIIDTRSVALDLGRGSRLY